MQRLLRARRGPLPGLQPNLRPLLSGRIASARLHARAVVARAVRHRDRLRRGEMKKQKPSRFRKGFRVNREEVSVLGRPGSDLLFQALRLSTIGAGEFNGRVRDGIGYRLPANTTRPAKDGCSKANSEWRIANGRLRSLPLFAIRYSLFANWSSRTSKNGH